MTAMGLGVAVGIDVAVTVGNGVAVGGTAVAVAEMVGSSVFVGMGVSTAVGSTDPLFGSFSAITAGLHPTKKISKTKNNCRIKIFTALARLVCLLIYFPINKKTCT